MNRRSHTLARRVAALGAAVGLLALIGRILPAAPASASSHREAPLIAADPYADLTDVYAFVSPDRNDSVTLIASWSPFEKPDGGPNFYRFADDALYEIHVDNVGDAQSHISYQFTFHTETRNPATFLYNTGPVMTLEDSDWNVRQTYTVTEKVLGPHPESRVIAANLVVPPANIGSKSTPNYAALAARGIHTITTPDGAIKVFAGPTDDPFFVDLGSVFDLLSLRPQRSPVGYEKISKGVDGLAGYNVHSIALQVPIARLTQGSEPVIGVWSTTSRRATRVLAALGSKQDSGDWVQVSRLGMPLVNEAVLPLALKDAFNGLPADQDYALFTSGTPAGDLLQKSVLDPELQRLLQALYAVPNPGKQRTDLLAIFLTGMKTTKAFTIHTAKGSVTLPPGTNVNQPANVRPAEMIRLNTAAPFRPGHKDSLCAPKPSSALGLLGGDACGFPNGRRLADDVTDIELFAVAGAAYGVLTDGSFEFDGSLLKVLRDGVDANDKPFASAFPYLANAHQGQVFRTDDVNKPPYLPRALRPF